MSALILLRNNLYTHVTAIFPRHDELIKRYASAAYYLTVHGVDEHGIIVGESASPEYDDDDAADEEAGEGPLSSYKSRPPLDIILKSLMSNKFERMI